MSFLFGFFFFREQNVEQSKKGKQARKWDLSGNVKDLPILDYSAPLSNDNNGLESQQDSNNFYDQNVIFLNEFFDELKVCLD